MTNDLLAAKYCEILKDIKPEYLANKKLRLGGDAGLSGLFLPSVAEGYKQAKNKVMIVGREPRGWDRSKKDGDFESIETCVRNDMSQHRNFFEKEMKEDKKNDRGNSFHNYARAVKDTVGADGLIYSNLFCFSWGKPKGSPANAPKEVFKVIKEYSKKILDAQIEILQPDYIVFANGISSATYRREFFPHTTDEDAGRCSAPKTHAAVGVKYFWEFMLDEKIRCFRIQHPSAQSRAAAAGRKYSIEMLKGAVA